MTHSVSVEYGKRVFTDELPLARRNFVVTTT